MLILLALLWLWLGVAAAVFLVCIHSGHSRQPAALLWLAIWSITWPVWGAWVAFLNLLGYGKTS